MGYRPVSNDGDTRAIPPRKTRTTGPTISPTCRFIVSQWMTEQPFVMVVTPHARQDVAPYSSMISVSFSSSCELTFPSYFFVNS